VIELSLQTAVDGDTVHASGRVNLPDGTRLSVGLQRTIIDPERPDDPGYLDVDYADTTVADGRYSYDLVDNAKRDAAAFVSAYNEGEPPARHQRVGEQVRVAVSFSPQTDDQLPAAVAAAGGLDGSALATSPQRKEIGEWTDDPYRTLLAEREFAKPLP
jgi:hypothetical protein